MVEIPIKYSSLHSNKKLPFKHKGLFLLHIKNFLGCRDLDDGIRKAGRFLFHSKARQLTVHNFKNI